MSTLHKLIFKDIIDFKQLLNPNKRILGFDYGTARIGCAVSDYSGKIALAVKLFDHKNKFNSKVLDEIITEYDIGGLVVGYPFQMDGLEGKSCALIDKFIANFLIAKNLPIFLQDERLSSFTVNKGMKQLNFDVKKRLNSLDIASATYLLQIVLDKLNLEYAL